MWLVARCLPQLAFDVPFRRVSAAAIGSTALVMLVLAVRPFRHAGTTVDPRRPERASTLVTDGVHSLSRNPMYVAMALALIAWGVYLANAVALLLAPAAFVIYVDRRRDPRRGACARCSVRRAVRAVHPPGPSLDLRMAG